MPPLRGSTVLSLVRPQTPHPIASAGLWLLQNRHSLRGGVDMRRERFRRRGVGEFSPDAKARLRTARLRALAAAPQRREQLLEIALLDVIARARI